VTREAKMRHCWYCGDELGVYADYDRMDTCGKRECERERGYAEAEDRAEAHRQLDEDMDW
jgi:hypothetical protein